MPVTTHTPGEVPGREVIYNSGHESEVAAGHPAELAREDEDKMSSVALAGGSSLELLGGAAAVVLAIIGLTGYLPLYMTSIAAIVIGGAVLAHGAAVTARWTDTMQRAAAGRNERVEIAGGTSSELLGGAAAIVLGILALAGTMPFVLLSVAAIVVGGTVLMGAPAQPAIARLAPDRNPRISHMTYEAVEAGSGAMVLAGLGAIVLGILALIHVGPAFTMVQIAMLAVGCAVLLGGSALTARFARRLQQVR